MCQVKIVDIDLKIKRGLSKNQKKTVRLRIIDKNKGSDMQKSASKAISEGTGTIGDGCGSVLFPPRRLRFEGLLLGLN